MPRLWSETIDAHRRSVRDAILDAAARLLDERGLASLTMSHIAEQTGIGRATLYKYFPDVEAVALAWHQRLLREDLERLARVGERTADAGDRLRTVLEEYALIHHRRANHHHAELSALLHGGGRGSAHGQAQAHADLQRFLRELLAAGVEAGRVRRDISVEELAAYCLYALRAAHGMPSPAAVRRLVEVTMRGLRPEGG